MVTTPAVRQRDAALLRSAIDVSGLSDRGFAGLVLVRDERTVRHWLDCSRPMPGVVRRRLSAIVDAGRVWPVVSATVGAGL